MKPFKTYFGGKGSNGTYQTIINNIRPHYCFIELFAGNATIYREMKKSNRSILNDIDSNVFEKLCEFYNDINTSCTNKDFEDIINHIIANAYNMGNVCLYCDPPYILSSRKSEKSVYDYEMSDDDHIRFLGMIKLLNSLTSNVDIIISTYPNNLYSEYLKDWNVIEFESSTRNGMAKELLYMNYFDIDALHDYRFIGDSFTNRQSIKKKQKSLLAKVSKLSIIERNAFLEKIAEAYNV